MKILTAAVFNAVINRFIKIGANTVNNRHFDPGQVLEKWG